MKLQLLAFALIILASFGAASAQEDAGKKELAALAGDWRLVKGEANGESANDYVIENLLVTGWEMLRPVSTPFWPGATSSTAHWGRSPHYKHQRRRSPRVPHRCNAG